MIRAAELSGISPIVRIGMNIQQHIQRFLDAGAQGVLIPLVNNEEDAKKNAKDILKLGVKNVVITLGEKGVYFENADENYFIHSMI